MQHKALILTAVLLMQSVVILADLPTTITTTDGQTYQGVSLIRTEPDGFLVNYEPSKNSIGMAKIKFAKLSVELQKQAGYNPDKAREFEAAVTRANNSLAQESANWDAAARAERQSRQAREDQMDLQRLSILAQLNQTQAAQEQTTGGNWDGTSLGGGYGVFALPRFVNRQVKTGFQPAPGHIPFASPIPARPPHK
jgi:hypothetical protein